MAYAVPTILDEYWPRQVNPLAPEKTGTSNPDTRDP